MAFRSSLSPLASGRALFGITPLLDLHRDMNRLFDGAMRDLDGRQPAAVVPRIDVHETPEEYCLSADLPGVTKDDVELSVEGDILTVAGERKAASEQAGNTWHITERSYGRFERSLKLPFAPDAGKVSADFENGVLTVHVPKAAASPRGRRIDIGGGQSLSRLENAVQGDTAKERTAESESQRAIDKASRLSQSVKA